MPPRINGGRSAGHLPEAPQGAAVAPYERRGLSLQWLRVRSTAVRVEFFCGCDDGCHAERWDTLVLYDAVPSVIVVGMASRDQSHRRPPRGGSRRLSRYSEPVSPIGCEYGVAPHAITPPRSPKRRNGVVSDAAPVTAPAPTYRFAGRQGTHFTPVRGATFIVGRGCSPRAPP